MIKIVLLTAALALAPQAQARASVYPIVVHNSHPSDKLWNDTWGLAWRQELSPPTKEGAVEKCEALLLRNASQITDRVTHEASVIDSSTTPTVWLMELKPSDSGRWKASCTSSK